MFVGAAFAKSLDLGIDNSGIDGADDVWPEAEAFDCAGGEILDEDVRRFRHLLDQFQAARGFQVDGDGFLVGVELQEIPGIAAGQTGRTAARIAAFRVFHFDHFRTEPGEGLGAGRTCLELSQIENFNSGEAILAAFHVIHGLAPPCFLLPT